MLLAPASSLCSRAGKLAGALVLAALVLPACGKTKLSRKSSSAPAPVPAHSSEVTVEDHMGLVATFPCASCHKDRKPNPEPRKLLEYHTAKSAFDHGTKSGWCYRCHSIVDIDKLHIADGTPVSFSHPEELCGSCHGDKLIDWRLGLHGLQRGSWYGPKVRRSCTFCHNPHKPAFEEMVPERPPDVLGPSSPREKGKS